jgi:hypothetical protein
MQNTDLKLADVRRDDAYDLSFPRRPERCAALEEKFPGLPLLIVDTARRLVWGHDYRRWLQGKCQKSAVIFMAEIAPAAALFLNFNLSNRLFGLNLYEKLLFVRKITGLCPRAEIQRRAELDFPLNDALLCHLAALMNVSFRPLLAGGQLGLKAALRLAEIAAPDRRALLGSSRPSNFPKAISCRPCSF